MWIVVIIILLILLVSGIQSNRQPGPKLNLNDGSGSVGRTAAASHVASLEKAIQKGDYGEMAVICDSILDDISYLLTLSDCYAYREAIVDAGFVYYGNRYPGRRNVLLEDLVREKVNERADELAFRGRR